MNKADLVAKVADKTGFKKKDAELALDAVLGTIEEALVAEQEQAETLRSQTKLSPSRLPRLLYSRQASPLRMLSTSNSIENKETRIACRLSALFDVKL